MTFKRKNGYTLIEMVVVIGIIVILTVLSMPEVNGLSEKNQLRNTADTIKQAILEARANSLSPKVKNNQTYNLYEVKLVKGTSIWKDDNVGDNSTVGKKDLSNIDTYPVAVRAAIVPCGSTEATNIYDLKTIELPANIIISEFIPSAVATNNDATLQFPTSTFNMSCSGKAINHLAWGNSSIFTIKLEDKNVKEDGSYEYIYIHVNKYSGQVWVSKSLSVSMDNGGGKDASNNIIIPTVKKNSINVPSGRVVLPTWGDITDLKSDNNNPVQDRTMWKVDKDGKKYATKEDLANQNELYASADSGGEWTKIPIVFFQIGQLGGKIPTKARLWMTASTANISTNLKFNVYLLNNKFDKLGLNLETSFLGGTVDGEASPFSGCPTNTSQPCGCRQSDGCDYDMVIYSSDVNTNEADFIDQLTINAKDVPVYVDIPSSWFTGLTSNFTVAIVPQNAGDTTFYSTETLGSVFKADATGRMAPAGPMWELFY